MCRQAVCSSAKDSLWRSDRSPPPLPFLGQSPRGQQRGEKQQEAVSQDTGASHPAQAAFPRKARWCAVTRNGHCLGAPWQAGNQSGLVLYAGGRRVGGTFPKMFQKTQKDRY